MSTNRNTTCQMKNAVRKQQRFFFTGENVSTFRAPGLKGCGLFQDRVGKMEKEMFSGADNKRGSAKQGGKDEKNPSKEVKTLPPYP